MSDLLARDQNNIETTSLYRAQTAQERLCAFACQIRVAREVAASIAEGSKNELPRSATCSSITNVSVNGLFIEPTWGSVSRCVGDRSAVAPSMLKHPPVFILC